MAVQWLSALHTSTARDTGLIQGQGTKSLHATGAILKNKNKKRTLAECFLFLLIKKKRKKHKKNKEEHSMHKAYESKEKNVLGITRLNRRHTTPRIPLYTYI